jgi:uncharacterized integral membrane protein
VGVIPGKEWRAMKSLFLSIILLVFLSSGIHADPVEEVFTYFDSTAEAPFGIGVREVPRYKGGGVIVWP